MLGALLGLLPSIAAGAVFVVDDDGAQCPSAHFTRIQAAVDAAAAGDTVHVCAGLYRESVHVPRTLRLLGAPRPVTERTGDVQTEAVVEPLGRTPAFTLAADGVWLEGFTVQNGDSGSVGVRTLPAFSGQEVSDSAFLHVDWALEVGNADAARPTHLRGNLTWRPQSALRMVGARGVVASGNQFESSRDTVIARASLGVHLENNTVSGGFGVGVFFTDCTGSVIVANHMRNGSLNGIVVNGGDAQVEGNVISDGQLGPRIAIENVTGGVLVANNTISGPGAGGDLTRFEAAIHVRDSRGVWLLDNRVTTVERGYGVLLEGGGGHWVLGNDVQGARVDGLRTRAGSTGNVLLLNHAQGSGEHDAHDEQRSANAWLLNTCTTDFPDGSICP
ncbi:right-handed parallel beta-helix repeat-containing protein [Corallococcus caeni]|uniref:Right handed beta helix domain-containing protein n=1 Tax=Corallococcus caeni TaxID=3082388 RepID=A0ABQ6R4P8_9BACT|nr:hypothetical protein ASNO1_75370 [Corallococcus sp. NO1]